MVIPSEELLLLYVEKMTYRNFVVMNIWQKKTDSTWLCNIRTESNRKKMPDISLGQGDSPGEALKDAYRKLWPAKRKKKKKRRRGR